MRIYYQYSYSNDYKYLIYWKVVTISIKNRNGGAENDKKA